MRSKKKGNVIHVDFKAKRPRRMFKKLRNSKVLNWLLYFYIVLLVISVMIIIKLNK